MGEPPVRAYNDSVFDNYGNNKQAGHMKRRTFELTAVYLGITVIPDENGEQHGGYRRVLE